MPSQKSPFLTGFKSGIPIGISFIVSFLALGTSCKISGFGFNQAWISTTIMFAGPAQFAVVSLLSAHAALTTIFLSIALINFRFFIMSCQLNEVFKEISLKKILMALPMLSASTFAVGQSPEKNETAFNHFLGVCASSYPVAIISTAAGYLISGFFSAKMVSVIPALVPIYFATLLAREKNNPILIMCALCSMGLTPLFKLVHADLGPIFAIIMSASIFAFWPTNPEAQHAN